MNTNLQNIDKKTGYVKGKDSKYKRQKKNNYNIMKLIGQGTFGKVYLAQTPKQGLVAIKIVHDDQKIKNRELQILTALDHFNVVKIKDFYQIYQDKERFINIIMEYIPTTLHGFIKNQKQVPNVFSNEIIKIYSFQLFKALSYFSEMSLCHRDLKPSNILINPQIHELKICDFGSAKFLQKEQQNISYICSRYYRAPQLLLGYSKYNTQIDIWSLGCILVELIILQPLFPGDSTLEQMLEIIKILGTPSREYIQKYSNLVEQLNLPLIKPHPWKRLFRYHSHVDEKLIDLISRCLMFDPEERISPTKALLHPYFSDILDQKYHKLYQKIEIFNFSKNSFAGESEQQKMIINKYKEPKQIAEIRQNRLIENKQNLQKFNS